MHLRPRYTSATDSSQSDEDETSNSNDSNEDDGPAGERPEMTAAERLAEKRKMKRFRLVVPSPFSLYYSDFSDRLTHAQTRYLMNEFAHQAHPDAAQRERLSNSIPGLSPRQVQVWFQNR